MFLLDDIAPVHYADPWDLPVQERLRVLASGHVRIAYFYEAADNSTFRYRIYNMAQVLNDGSGDVSAAYFFLDDMDRVDEIADLADLLVVCRVRYDQHVMHLISAFRRRRKRVLFDTDDLVFDSDYVHLLIETLDLDTRSPHIWNGWFAYVSRIGTTLKQCDGAIATTEPLAQRIREFADLPVAIVPNFMNQEQLALSERIFSAKQGQAPGQSGLIHLGYFSGSPTHNRDFAVAEPALDELLADNPGLGLVVAGYLDPGPRLARFASRIERFPMQDFINLQRLIGSVEFNLMPLQYNAFTNSKSELKYFEAAAVGTVSIASPSDTYARAISHGDTGYLARQFEWTGVIRQALGDRERYQAMAVRGRADALSRYAWTVQRQRIVCALGLD